jgi:hypothetical protein
VAIWLVLFVLLVLVVLGVVLVVVLTTRRKPAQPPYPPQQGYPYQQQQFRQAGRATRSRPMHRRDIHSNPRPASSRPRRTVGDQS